MHDVDPSVAQRIAIAASAFEEKRTGHAPRSVTVVLAADTLVVTLHGTLSEAEKLLARTPAGAAKVQEFHRQLFEDAAGPLRAEIARITGVAVREAQATVEPATGTVVQVFSTGAMVQVFLMAGPMTPDTWSGSGAIKTS
ncbi:MAG TPA: Na-translocating system protein MpsC family protein [Gemmataceae bacterium]|nr:Na-translocating system protein MpsC family protein [Gemmataceae bacterium]